MGSKAIWGSAFSGKSLTICWRAKALLENSICPLILCFSTHHRALLRRHLFHLGISDKIRVYTFKEWMLYNLAQGNSIASYTRVINREESLLWLKSHQNKWSGNDDPEMDLEIIWTEKIYSPEGKPSEYVDLVQNYQIFLKQNHFVDEVDLCNLFEKVIITLSNKNFQYLLIDEAHEASALELQLLSKLLIKNNLEIFIDYNQGVMAWRTPLPPVSLKEFNKFLKVKKTFYLSNNYFNAKSIVNCGLKVIRKNKNRISKKMNVLSKTKGDLHFYIFDTQEEEGLYIANNIKAWVDDPLNEDGQIGVLVRNHQQAQEIAVYLESVLASPYFAHSFFRQPSAQKILALVRVMINTATDLDFDVLMNSWGNLKAKDAYFECKKSLEKHQLYFSSIANNSNLQKYLSRPQNDFVVLQKVFSPTNKVDIFSCQKIVDQESFKNGTITIEQLEDDNFQISFENEGESIWQELSSGSTFAYYHGFYAQTLKYVPGVLFVEKNQLSMDSYAYPYEYANKIKEAINTLNNDQNFLLEWQAIAGELKSHFLKFQANDLMSLKGFNSFFEEESFVDLPKLNKIYLGMYLNHLSPLQNIERFSRLSRLSSYHALRENSKITLCTIHEGRHMFFDKLFIPRLHQFEFPHTLSSSGNKLEEERRLFYTALMRSKKNVVLSSVKKNHHISCFIQEAGLI
jgi:superfamily I DNA/RNA helicase